MEMENSIKIGPPTIHTCPLCETQNSVVRIYEVPLMIYDNTPKTVGTLAERNTTANRMRNSEHEDKTTKRYQSYWDKVNLREIKNINKYIETGIKS